MYFIQKKSWEKHIPAGKQIKLSQTVFPLAVNTFCLVYNVTSTRNLNTDTGINGSTFQITEKCKNNKKTQKDDWSALVQGVFKDVFEAGFKC